MSEFVYLYGFVPSDASAPNNVVGIANAPVRLVPVGPVQAAISEVPADEFDPRRIEARMQDLSWVAQQGAAHETVVAWFVDHAEILPVPLFTMYSNAHALKDAAGTNAAHYESELVRLRNKREWDVKISYDERELEKHAAQLSPVIAELQQQADAASPGKRYLLQKKRNDLLKSESRAAALRVARQTLEAVSDYCIEQRVLPIPRTADDLPVVAYSALLVERQSEVELVQALEEAATQLKALGMAVAFSGPWAAYRFTGTDERSTAS